MKITLRLMKLSPRLMKLYKQNEGVPIDTPSFIISVSSY